MILPLTLEGVSYSSGGQPIISGVSLTLEAGPSTIILGANGAGKSVLMRLMHGLLAPSAGTIRWNENAARRRQAMVFQRPVMLRRSAKPKVASSYTVTFIFPAKPPALSQVERLGNQRAGRQFGRLTPSGPPPTRNQKSATTMRAAASAIFQAST